MNYKKCTMIVYSWKARFFQTKSYRQYVLCIFLWMHSFFSFSVYISNSKIVSFNCDYTKWIHKQQFTQFLDSENSVNCVLLSAEQIAEIVAIYSSPCPIISGRARQRYYRIRKKYIIKQTQSCKLLYSISTDTSAESRVLSKEEMFDVFQ